MLLGKQKTPVDTAYDENFTPTRIVEIELGQPLPIIQARDNSINQYYRKARCLVRLHDQPLGLIELHFDEEGAQPKEYAPYIWSVFSEKINDHLQLDGMSPLTEFDERGLISPDIPGCIETRERFLEHAPFVSIIVATHDRPQKLAKCLHALLALHYPRYEIIIVDNAPSTTLVADMFQEIKQHNPNVRYLLENRPGSSIARNCGVAHACGEILAFTDDDVVVDQYWLVEMVRAFYVATDVVCVTGLILALELETPAQLWFEEKTYPERLQHVGLCPGFARRIFDMRKNNAHMPLHPYIAGRFGAGASMAFTKAFIQSISGFDPVLGGGSPTHGGEDHATFLKAIARGYKLVYEPAAIAYHCHRQKYEDLYKQMYGYGTGFIAYLMRSLLTDPRLIFDFISKLPSTLFFILRRKKAQNPTQFTHYPRELNQALNKVEMRGRFYGPITYVQSLWALQTAHKTKH